MKYFTLFSLLFFFCFTGLCFTTKPDSTDKIKPLVYEKVYLHIDRELYSQGDEVWFKSYLVGGINHRLLQGYKNIYVQLISEEGTVIQDRLLLSLDGVANGSFQIPPTIPDGSYIIRARTKYLENFGEQSLFHQKIIVSGMQKALFAPEKPDEQIPAKIDVSFLPEGGSLILNAANHIAFKAIDDKGKGIFVSGKILDDDGNETASFRTDYKGMGSFVMMPVEGKSYHTVVDGYPDFQYYFGSAALNGMALHCITDAESLRLVLSRNFTNTDTLQLEISASHKGIELFRDSISFSGFQNLFRIHKKFFPRGISKIRITDQKNNFLTERLVFIEGLKEPQIEFNFNKTTFMTREKAEIEVTAFKEENDTIPSSFSISVVNEDYLSARGYSQTLESFLLLDSDLKGYIESPAGYFTDDDSVTSQKKLDLLMLVNGWSSYYWNELEAYAGKELPDWADIGVSVKGYVQGIWNKTPIPKCKIKLGPFSRNLLFEETFTDSLGRFGFDRLYLKDSAKVMITAQRRKDGRRTEIFFTPSLKLEKTVPMEIVLKNCPPAEIPWKFYREIYNRQMLDKDFITQNILLDKIDIFGKNTEYDGHYRLYGEADISFDIGEDDYFYLDIMDYLQGKVAGMTISGDEIRIRTSTGNPLFLVDGIETDWSLIKIIAMSDIDKIEVLKSGYNMAIYGSKGGNGVIAVYTKTGNTSVDYEKYEPGKIIPRVQGFQKPKQFYSPKYTPENIDDPVGDYRATLFWEPNLKFENNKAKVEFFTSDKLARYMVYIEGITKNGKILNGSGQIIVDKHKN